MFVIIPQPLHCSLFCLGLSLAKDVIGIDLIHSSLLQISILFTLFKTYIKLIPIPIPCRAEQHNDTTTSHEEQMPSIYSAIFLNYIPNTQHPSRNINTPSKRLQIILLIPLPVPQKHRLVFIHIRQSTRTTVFLLIPTTQHVTTRACNLHSRSGQSRGTVAFARYSQVSIVLFSLSVSVRGGMNQECGRHTIFYPCKRPIRHITLTKRNTTLNRHIRPISIHPRT
jgi:hypothetical protein